MKASLPYRIAQVLLLLALVRHLALALFIHPFADDFSYAVAGISTPLGERLLQEYTAWNGRYFSNVLVLRGPLVLGIGPGLPLYRLVAVVLILLTAAAAYHCLRVLLPRIGRVSAGTAAVTFLLLFLHMMPDASEGFYWYTGAVTYQLANVLCLILAANWVRVLRTLDAVPARWYVVQCVLVAVIAGENELHAAFMVLTHFGLLVWGWKRVGKVHHPALVLLLVAMLCTLVVVLAPGNATRGALFPMRNDPVRTLLYSVAQTGRFALQWVLLLVLPTLLFLTILRKGIRRGVLKPFAWPMNKWIVLLLPFAAVFVNMVIVYWSTGLLGQYRTVNVALFFFIPTWFFAAAVWDQKYFGPRGWRIGNVDAPRSNWAIVLLCTCVFWAGRDGRVSDDLLSGRMARYDEGMLKRYRTMAAERGSGTGVIILAPVEAPRSLEVLPLDTSAAHWINSSFAAYFGVGAVRLSSAPPVAPAK